MNHSRREFIAVAVFAASAIGTVVCAAGNEIYRTDFDSPEAVKGWRTSDKWKVAEGAGVGGSAAFVWTNDDPKSYDVVSFVLPGVKDGMRLEATFKVKVDSLSGANLGCTIAWDGKEGWLGGAGGTVLKWGDKRLKPDADGWYSMAIRTPYLPGKMTVCSLQLYIHRGGVGKVRFDDVRVSVIDERQVGGINSIGTSRHRNIAVQGAVKVAASIELPGDLQSPEKAVAALSYVGADGNRRTRRMDISPTMDLATTTIDVAELAMGVHPLAVSLKGLNGRDFGKRETVFERVAELPRRRVTFDAHNRTIVDGRPFFPLGMYWSPDTLSISNSLERYTTGPFNCLQTYELSMTPEILDRYWAHGLRVIASVKDIYAPVEGAQRIGFNPPEIRTRTDETNYIRRVVERCRNHPALLAWYTCDEIPEEYHDRLLDRHSLMHELDPEHPTFVCICHPGSSRTFMDSADVIGVDPYPVPGTDDQNRILPPGLGKVWMAGDFAQTVKDGMLDFLPTWHVPQAFAWKWEKRGERMDERFPTTGELRNMAWQMIAVGANGILFYSYGQMLRCWESADIKEEYFRRTCEVAREIRAQVPILMLDPGPAVTDKPERVRVRTWRDGDAAYALVCNTHPEPRRGAVRIEGGWRAASSVFGECATFVDDALVLDMPSLGIAIVKLKR